MDQLELQCDDMLQCEGVLHKSDSCSSNSSFHSCTSHDSSNPESSSPMSTQNQQEECLVTPTASLIEDDSITNIEPIKPAGAIKTPPKKRLNTTASRLNDACAKNNKLQEKIERLTAELMKEREKNKVLQRRQEPLPQRYESILSNEKIKSSELSQTNKALEVKKRQLTEEKVRDQEDLRSKSQELQHQSIEISSMRSTLCESLDNCKKLEDDKLLLEDENLETAHNLERRTEELTHYSLEHHRLHSQIHELQETNESVVSELKDVVSERDELQTKFHIASDEKHQITMNLNKSEKNAVGVQNNLLVTKDKLAVVEKDRDEYRKQRENARNTLVVRNEEIEELKKKIEEIKKKSDIYRQQSAAAHVNSKKECDAYRLQSDAAYATLKTANEKNESLENAKEQWTKEKQIFEGHVEQLQTDYTKEKETREGTDESCKFLANKVEKLEKEILQLKSWINDHSRKRCQEMSFNSETFSISSPNQGMIIQHIPDWPTDERLDPPARSVEYGRPDQHHPGPNRPMLVADNPAHVQPPQASPNEGLCPPAWSAEYGRQDRHNRINQAVLPDDQHIAQRQCCNVEFNSHEPNPPTNQQGHQVYGGRPLQNPPNYPAGLYLNMPHDQYDL